MEMYDIRPGHFLQLQKIASFVDESHLKWINIESQFLLLTMIKDKKVYFLGLKNLFTSKTRRRFVTTQ